MIIVIISGKTRNPRWNIHQAIEMQLVRHLGDGGRGKILESYKNKDGSPDLLGLLNCDTKVKQNTSFSKSLCVYN